MWDKYKSNQLHILYYLHFVEPEQVLESTALI